MRGSSALLGAADCVMQVTPGRLTIEKNKDGTSGTAHQFELKVHDLGVDDEGDPITSCHVVFEVSDDAKLQSRKRPKSESPEHKMLNELHHLLIDGKNREFQHHDRIPRSAMCVMINGPDSLREACRKKGLSVSEATNDESRRRSEDRAFKSAFEIWRRLVGWLSTMGCAGRSNGKATSSTTNLTAKQPPRSTTKIKMQVQLDSSARPKFHSSVDL